MTTDHWALKHATGPLGDELREEYARRVEWEEKYVERAFAWLWMTYNVRPGDMVRLKGEAQGRIVLRTIVTGEFQFAGCTKKGRMYENSSGFARVTVGDEHAAIELVMPHAERDHTNDTTARMHESPGFRPATAVPVFTQGYEAAFPQRARQAVFA